MPHVSQYSFWGALRLFSLAVALISCSLGILLGWSASDPKPGLAILLLIGGILSQAGMNLINDIEDLGQMSAKSISADTKHRIHRNQRLGWIAFGLAAIIGVYLITLRGWPLLFIFILSALLALNYNSGPLNFKHRGIAIVQVFALMGVIMVESSYFVMTGHFSWQAIWLSLPVSLLISLLLLSNEIRDYESDVRDRVGTLTSRIGLSRAQTLYWILIACAILLVILYVYLGWVSNPAYLLPALCMLPFLKHHLYASNRNRLTPLSGQFFLVFGVAYLLML